jgi:hypothetical protein
MSFKFVKRKYIILLTYTMKKIKISNVTEGV